jgi:CTP:molybdopterin cytidylyltransferase MocA
VPRRRGDAAHHRPGERQARQVADADGVADDVDTPDDLVQARQRVAGEGSPT